MRKEIEEILYNPTNDNIAKLGIMLADSDKKLMELEIKKISNTEKKDNTKQLENMAAILSKEEFLAYKKKLDETNNNKEIEMEFLQAKAEYREVAIAFDTIRLIVQNKSSE